MKAFLILLLVVGLFQLFYSVFFFRRASRISKTTFKNEAELGDKSKPIFKFTMYGDSVGAGVGATSFETSLAGRLTEFLSQKHHLLFKNNSVSGHKMGDVLNMPAPKEKQDLILLVVSSNNLFRLTSLEKFERDTKEVMEKYSSQAEKVIIVGPGRLFDAGAVPVPMRLVYKILAPKYSRIVSNTVSKYPNIVHIDPINPPIDPKSYKGKPSYDRFHPSDDGYIFWFEMVKTAL
jgi:lysophospholipase L1-like esterase